MGGKMCQTTAGRRTSRWPTRRSVLATGVGGLVLAASASCTFLAGASDGPWLEADAILRRIRAPIIPRRDFAIARFGAEPGKDCTAAIAAAIAAASAAGGGRVVV